MLAANLCRLDGDASVDEIMTAIICRLIYQMPSHDRPIVGEWIKRDRPLPASPRAICAMVRALPEADRLALLDGLLRYAGGRPQ